MVTSMVYRAISTDIKERAIFFVDHPELCGNGHIVLWFRHSLLKTAFEMITGQYLSHCHTDRTIMYYIFPVSHMVHTCILVYV